MNTTHMDTTTRIKGLGALAAGLPDLVGPQVDGGIFVLFEGGGGLVGVLGWDEDANEGETTQMLDLVAERRRMLGADAAIVVAHHREPGRVDVTTLATRIARRVPVHHVLGVSEEHWWALECEKGCCDGAIHEIPALDEATRGHLRDVRVNGRPGAEPKRAVPSIDDVTQAWANLCAVPDGASATARRARSRNLDVLADAVVDGVTRDHLVLRVAPELFCLLGLDLPAAGPDQTMTSGQVRAWLPLMPRHGRAPWKALEAAAMWREGDLAGARACAAASLRLGRNSLAELMRDITAAGLSYEKAVGSARARSGAAFFV